MVDNASDPNSETSDEDFRGVEKPCLKCRSEISALAEKCPKCGYDPRIVEKGVGVFAIALGMLVSLTIIGALIGIPMIIVGGWFVQNKGSEKRPTNTAPSEI